jgi:hypothetical protein
MAQTSKAMHAAMHKLAAKGISGEKKTGMSQIPPE